MPNPFAWTACGIFFASVAGSALAAEPVNSEVPELRTTPALIAPAPKDVSRPSCVNAIKYVELLDTHRNGEIGPLFAENAVHYGPDGVTRHGRKTIQEFYAARPLPKDDRVYVAFAMQEGKDCVLELASGVEGKSVALRALDHFKVNAKGEIEWFLMWISPPGALPKDELATKFQDRKDK